jgi:hypothetical protein
MARLVFIVSRQRPELASYLRRQFSGVADVDVIVDRRIGDRRLAPIPITDDRRKVDRRQEYIDNRLDELGWAIVWRHKGTTVYVHQDETSAGPAPAQD